MDNQKLLDLIKIEMPKLAEEYKRHAELHRKQARFWLVVMFLEIVFLIIFICL